MQSNPAPYMLAVGVAALGAVVLSNRKAATTTPASTTPASTTPATTTPATTTPTTGTGAVVKLPGGVTLPLPTSPTVPKMTTPAATAGTVPAGPSWAGEPAINAKTLLDQRTDDLAAFLARVQPYWKFSPVARRRFASELVAAAHAERYPLDLLVGHCWAEGALKPYMSATAGSGAYGPLQVTAIACKDVGMAYPPTSPQAGAVVGIRLLRLYAQRHSEAAGSITNALRMYGLGYGGFTQFQQYGCGGTPCGRSQSVWRHECGCSGASNRYTWKVREMAGKAAAAGLHTLPWSAWRVKA